MSRIRQSGSAPTETRSLSAGADVSPHRHGDHQLVYASSGVLELFVPDGIWFTPSVRALLVPAGTVHSWRVHGAATVHLIGLARSLMPILGAAPTLVAVDPLARELMIACADNGPAREASARRLLRVLVDRIRLESGVPSMIPALRDERLRDVEAAVLADLTTAARLSELGRQVGASERTLSRLFKEETGMSFPEWRTQVRLHQATLSLAKGLTVSRTAAECGWSSPSAFITSFRRAFGRTPGALYR